MARVGDVFLDADDQFPELEIETISGDKLSLPRDFGEGYAVFILYRGHWWPFCNQQLADFQSAIKEFEAEEITVIAGSVDPIEKAREIAEKAKVTFPVGYGLDPEKVSEITGAYYEKEKKFIHATNFLIRPDKSIQVACYSSGPIGRFVAQDVLRLVRFYKSRK